MENGFRKIKNKMLISTIYHFQTDGQSEKKKIQTVEIALQYFLKKKTTRELNVFPYIQTAINNVVNTATELVFIYGFRFNDTLKLITDLPFENFNRLRLIYRKQKVTLIVWFSAITKHRYDS